MKLKTRSSDRFRLVCILLFQVFLFSAIIAQFYKVQIIEGEKWEKVAENQHRKYETIPYKRGSFYSNTFIKKGAQKKQTFVCDVQKFHLYIDPLKIPEYHKKKIMEKLFSTVQTPFEEKKKIEKDFYKKTHFRKIFSYIDRSTLDDILAWWKVFYKKEKLPSNAIFYSQEYKRFYPLGNSLGQVLHTVLREKEAKTKHAIATGGLELIFQDLLRGKKGKKRLLRSAHNALDTHEKIEEKEDGADIYLTINHYIQAICEEELEKGIKKSNAKGGWAVMMDPYTGEIYALAQYPFFDLSSYQKYFNDPRLEPHSKCKAITDTFEPGSIMKPLILAIAMKANKELEKQGKQPLFHPDEKIATHDGRFPGRPFPLKDGRRRRFMNMDLAVQKSANIYMGKIMQRMVETMGDMWLKKALEELGFGQKTGIEMPAEALGIVPTPGKLHPNNTLEWSTPTPYSLAIGHNILVNTMQMAIAYSMIANGGYKVAPTLVKKIVKEKNGEKILIPHEKKSPLKKVISTDITNRLVQSMKFVTKIGGTSRGGDLFGYTEAGKSGSSEKIINGKYSHDHYISSFAGFTPVKDPRFVLIVVVDEPEKKFIPGVGSNYLGGVCASPIFSGIAKRTLRYLGVAPDDPFGYPYRDSRRDPLKADMTEEIKKLKKLDLEWNR